jgi:hypothetical protein
MNMGIARGSAAFAMFAGLALALATAPSSAADPLNGHYTETETYPDGHSVNTEWYFTPCGDGCASVAATPNGKPFGQANLANGQWTMQFTGGVDCEEGGDVPHAIKLDYTWDANTLAGNVQITNNIQACGNPPGYQETNQVKLAQAS